MKICSILIKGFQQFQDTFLDFTHPETGEPLDKICLIGKNGTGKSTVLNIISLALAGNVEGKNFEKFHGIVLIKIKDKNKHSYIVNFGSKDSKVENIYFSKSDIENYTFFKRIVKSKGSRPELSHIITSFLAGINKYIGIELESKYSFKNNNDDLFLKVPCETGTNEYFDINDVPKTDLNSALPLFSNRVAFNEISFSTIVEFWTLLIYNIKKRDNDQATFENLPENLNKTKRQLIEEFDQRNPKILTKIGELWNRILDHTGLEFDVEGASNPIQLTDNLKAYIKVKATGERIQYNQLSTGIRNFIFRLGHIYSLYFNREIKRGFLLVDEPENSLFPDFLYDLIDIYREITLDKNGENNTQSFFATHNPIIAAQFEPYERIILEWNAEGTVVAHKGVAPLGDDPNDLLKKDFEVRSLMGTVGVEKHKEYLTLRRELRNTSDEEKKKELLSKIGEIARAYEFD